MQHYYDVETMENKLAGEGYSTAIGTWVDGERIIFGKICIPAGTKADPHTHPNEQFIIILEGQCRFDIQGDVMTAGPGNIIHIPHDTVHSVDVVGDEDLVFITAKDTSWGIQGTRVED